MKTSKFVYQRPNMFELEVQLADNLEGTFVNG